jgi:hypothetical protein
VDRDAIAREVRRRQAQEALDFEREREQTLEEQIELVIGEAEGSRIDAAAYERMSPEDVAIVKAELTPPEFDPDDAGSFFERDDVFNFDDVEEVDPHAEELARLTVELEDCRRRQQAFTAYIAALNG